MRLKLWIAKKHELPVSLPDSFLQELNLYPTEEAEENLSALASCHRERSGTRLNWYCSYLHAVEVWQKGLGFKKA